MSRLPAVALLLAVVLVTSGCVRSQRSALRSDADVCRVLESDLVPGSDHRVVDLLTVWPAVPAGRGDLAVVVSAAPATIAAAVRTVAGVASARIGADGNVYADVPVVARRQAAATRIRAIPGVTDVRDANAGASSLYAAYGLATKADERAWTDTLRTLDGAGKGATHDAIGTVLDAHLDLMVRLTHGPVTDLVGGKGAVFSAARWQAIVAASGTVKHFADGTCGTHA